MKYVFLLIIALMSFVPEAQAHRPYLVKQGTVADPFKNFLILEKLYGDGILSSDPVSFQIRNHHGAVLGYTPTSTQVAFFCPQIEFCFAFPYNGFLPFAVGLKFNTQSIDWQSSVSMLEEEPKDVEAFKKYLTNEDETNYRSYSLEYPEFRRDSNGLNFTPVFWTFALSPFLIIVNHIGELVLATILMVIVPLLYWVFFKRLRPQKPFYALALKTLGALVIFGYFMCACLVILVLSLILGSPPFYVSLAIMIGMILPWIISRRRKRTDVS